MKYAYCIDILRKDTKSVCTSTTVFLLISCFLPHQLLQLWGCHTIQQRIPMTLTPADEGDIHMAYSSWLVLQPTFKCSNKKIPAIYIHSNEIHTVVALIKCFLILRCQLYMFRTVTVHPQELLRRYCMCRLWYVVRNTLSDTSSWYIIWGTTLCISLECIYIAKNDTRTFQCQVQCQKKIPVNT